MTARYIATGCNILEIEVETNCPQGGDSGHGGLTVLILRAGGSTDMEIETTDDSVRLVFGGDSECDTLLECLRFAVSELERQVRQNERDQKAASNRDMTR